MFSTSTRPSKRWDAARGDAGLARAGQTSDLKEEARKALRIPPNYGSINNTPLRATVGAQPVVFGIDIR
ncbi:hypothetical protein FRUB_07043 [Fimbriiglobus ruber]|uniref:Uncharacterized protein n=1 Tax=Fimbriiglobus ruber TaxID=1908690 RepID=A0A225DAD0_9BACT|nr:hypothetical protein FRUB_07043 [Fimbriiglobus ruber]